jgi:hypothetical protein
VILSVFIRLKAKLLKVQYSSDAIVIAAAKPLIIMLMVEA